MNIIKSKKAAVFVVAILVFLGIKTSECSFYIGIFLTASACFIGTIGFHMNRKALSFDSHTRRLYSDFPQARNFNELVLGGTEPFYKHGNKSENGILYITGPLRPFELNVEFAMLYFSYVKRGGKITILLDGKDVVPKRYSFADLSGLHAIQINRLMSTKGKISILRKQYPILFSPYRTMRLACFTSCNYLRRSHPEVDSILLMSLQIKINELTLVFQERGLSFSCIASSSQNLNSSGKCIE